MLYSQFFIGESRYIIAINQIVVVVPYVNLKAVPSLPDYAVGLLSYHGASVPVIDVCQLLISQPCARKLSTRIILTTLKIKSGADITIGLLVEGATETFTADEDEFIDPGISNPEMPFIGPVVHDSDGMLTKLIPQNIFERIDETLFLPDSAGCSGL